MFSHAEIDQLVVISPNTIPQASYLDDSDVEMLDIDDPAVISEINSMLSKNRETQASLPDPQEPPTDPLIEPLTSAEPDTSMSKVRTGLVLDTNFLISNLTIVMKLKTLARKYGYVIVVPWVVIQELDGLKSIHRKTDTMDDGFQLSVATLARKATDWIFSALAKRDPRVVGQKMTEICSSTPNLHGDDGILDCCMYFQKEKHFLTVIVSNDRNLCSKALIHDIKTVSYSKGLTAKEIAKVVQEETQSWAAMFDPDEDMVMNEFEDDDYHAHNESTQDESDLDTRNKLAPAHRGVSAQPSKDMEDLKKLKATLKKQTTVSGMRDLIVSILVEEVGHAVIAALAYEFSDPPDYDHFVRPIKIENLKDLTKTLETFRTSVFSDYFQRRIRFVNNPELDTIPKAKAKYLIQFLNAWGGIWIQLQSRHKPQSIEYVQNVMDSITARLAKSRTVQQSQ